MASHGVDSSKPAERLQFWARSASTRCARGKRARSRARRSRSRTPTTSGRRSSRRISSRCCARRRPSGRSRARSNDEHRRGTLRLRRLRPRSVLLDDEVRQRHRLAELLGAARQRGRHDARHSLGMVAHGGALPPLRRPSRPRVRRRPEADRPALLHERRRDEFKPRARLTRAANRCCCSSSRTSAACSRS